uniref:Protein quiver n=1 Tax=Romanomermis culicivorax TaxID=13658 RepID=A0A915IR78_ROMCU
MYVFCILAASISLNMALECFVCNNKPGDDDSMPCLDRKTDDCPDSCSAVYYQTLDKILHVRKFCTASGISMNRRALLSPGSSMCENVNTASMKTSDPSASQSAKNRASMPAPPTSQRSTLICVCSSDKCNAGDSDSMVGRLLLRNMNQKQFAKKPVFPAPPKFKVDSS